MMDLDRILEIFSVLRNLTMGFELHLLTNTILRIDYK
jgi:hypothetical protein